MAMFIMLARLSAEGVRSLKNNPHRIQEVNQEVEQFGARVVQQYALLGPYDFITVLEAPDPETVSRVSVELASRGAASYETLTAISVDEFVSRLGGEGRRTQEGERAQEGDEVTAKRLGSTAGPTGGTGGDAPLPPREQAREDVEDIKGEITREEAPRRRTEEGPPRTEEPPQQGREMGGQSDREREEDRGLIDRARDAFSGEEEPRRREGTDRPGQEDRPRR